MPEILESGTGIVGLEVEIMTETMRTSPFCGGRKWKITPESNQLINSVAGVDDPCDWMCEHYLELD